MARAIFVVDAFASGPFRGNPAAVVPLEPGDAPDAAWMQQVAAEMKHSETAFVQPAPTGRSTCGGSRPRSRSTCAATRRSRARTCSGRRISSQPMSRAVFHTRGGELRANRQADGAIELDFPTAPPEPCDAPAGLFEALGLDGGEMLRTTGQFFMVVVPDAATVRKLEPDFAAMRALARRARRLRDRARRRRRARHRVAAASRRASASTKTRSPVRCTACSARTGAHELGKTELRAEQASARGGTVGVKLAGDRTLLTGDAVTVLRGELLA